MKQNQAEQSKAYCTVKADDPLAPLFYPTLTKLPESVRKTASAPPPEPVLPKSEPPKMAPDKQAYSDISAILKEIKNNFGRDKLLQGDRCVAYFSNLAPNMSREKNLLQLFFKCGGAKLGLLSNAEALNQERRTVIQRLNCEYGMEKSCAEFICMQYLRSLEPESIPPSEHSQTSPGGSDAHRGMLHLKDLRPSVRWLFIFGCAVFLITAIMSIAFSVNVILALSVFSLPVLIAEIYIIKTGLPPFPCTQGPNGHQSKIAKYLFFLLVFTLFSVVAFPILMSLAHLDSSPVDSLMIQIICTASPWFAYWAVFLYLKNPKT